MFELSVALKYLIPRWRQLSVSIISIISIFVIALVVWLIVVFFSVTQGLEKSWVEKLIALTAPIRITPTDRYYKSYYHLADSVSMSSDYTLKTIGEKLAATRSDPYDPDSDQELPQQWPLPDRDLESNLKDPVKTAFAAIESLSGLKAKEYEMTFATIKLNLDREPTLDALLSDTSGNHPLTINQSGYLTSFDAENPYLSTAMLPVEKQDIENILHQASLESDIYSDGNEDPFTTTKKEVFQERLKNIFNIIRIKGLRTPAQGLKISKDLIPEGCSLEVCAVGIGKKLSAIYIPKDGHSKEKFLNKQFSSKSKVESGRLEKRDGSLVLLLPGEEGVPVGDQVPLMLDEGVPFRTALEAGSLESAGAIREIVFHAEASIQGAPLSGKIDYANLQLEDFALTPNEENPFWLYKDKLPSSLPSDMHLGDALLLPKGYRNAGVLIGDRGYLSYHAPTTSTIQEQRVPIYIAGFYDPGVFPMGGKIILANENLVSMIRSAYPLDGSPLTNGINVRFEDLEDAPLIKSNIQELFRKAGIDAYWKVETFREYEFTKDFLQQIRSERNLFSLISAIVIIVACSNIVSMLIILVNNKKMEIGILRSMGATSGSIAAIFGTCGIVMGLLGSMVGVIAATFTLKYLQVLIDLISRLQGFDAFNPIYYGSHLPNKVSMESLIFVIGATAVTSLIAGIVPAIKACLMRPTAILRSE